MISQVYGIFKIKLIETGCWLSETGRVAGGDVKEIDENGQKVQTSIIR